MQRRHVEILSVVLLALMVPLFCLPALAAEENHKPTEAELHPYQMRILPRFVGWDLFRPYTYTPVEPVLVLTSQDFSQPDAGLGWVTYNGKADLSNWPGDVLIAPFVGELDFDQPIHIGGSLLVGSNFAMHVGGGLSVAGDVISYTAVDVAGDFQVTGNFDCVQGGLRVDGNLTSSMPVVIHHGQLDVTGDVAALGVWVEENISAKSISAKGGYVNSENGSLLCKGNVESDSIKATFISVDGNIVASRRLWSQESIEATGAITSGGGISAGDFIRADSISAQYPIFAGVGVLAGDPGYDSARIICRELTGTIAYGRRAEKTQTEELNPGE
jgi:hypothetical protein